MADPLTLSGPERPPASGKSAKQLVVFLHGLGADGNDLISLTPEFAETLPDAHFCSPHAPFPCDMAPFGRQWFSLMEWTEAAMVEGSRRAAPILSRFLDEKLVSLGLKDANMALIGFSQGTMMALYTALRRPKPCAGIVGYSGALIAGKALEGELKSKPPVCLVHGAMDMVVPYGALHDAESRLSALGVPVEAHTRPLLGHGIDPEGIALGNAFLTKVFGI